MTEEYTEDALWLATALVAWTFPFWIARHLLYFSGQQFARARSHTTTLAESLWHHLSNQSKPTVSTVEMNWHTSIPCSVPHSLCCFRFFTVFFPRPPQASLPSPKTMRCTTVAWYVPRQSKEEHEEIKDGYIMLQQWTIWIWQDKDDVDKGETCHDCGDDVDDLVTLLMMIMMDDNDNDQDDDSWLMTRAHDMPNTLKAQTFHSQNCQDIVAKDLLHLFILAILLQLQHAENTYEGSLVCILNTYLGHRGFVFSPWCIALNVEIVFGWSAEYFHPAVLLLVLLVLLNFVALFGFLLSTSAHAEVSWEARSDWWMCSQALVAGVISSTKFYDVHYPPIISTVSVLLGCYLSTVTAIAV